MKYFIKSSEFEASISDLYNDIEVFRDDILSYPLDASQQALDERNYIAQQLKYVLCELSDAYQTLCDLRTHCIQLYEEENNVVVK